MKKLLKSENSGEKEKSISVNEVKYTPVPKKGDIIRFGHYPQNSDNQKSPIEWLVLDVKGEGKEFLLVSRYALDCKQYHHVSTDITWERCELRKWLNGDFLKSAFSEEEAERILVSDIRNDDNPQYHTKGGNNTKDRVFCLSISEAEQYFGNNKSRKCKPTAYARQHGAWVDNSNDCCCWWLRSPGCLQSLATIVSSDVALDGALDLGGDIVNIDDYAVRPTLRIICNQ